MQDKKMKEERIPQVGEETEDDVVVIGLPTSAFEEAGFEDDTVIQISAEKGKITLSAVEEEDVEDFTCDKNCWSCPCIKICKKAVK